MAADAPYGSSLTPNEGANEMGGKQLRLFSSILYQQSGHRRWRVRQAQPYLNQRPQEMNIPADQPALNC